MDSLEESKCMTNSGKINCDSEKSRNCNRPPKQRGLNENAENVFTSTSGPSDLNHSSLSDPRSRMLNCLSIEDPGSHITSRLAENNAENYNKNNSCSVQSSNNTINNYHLEAAGSSKAELVSRDNGLPSSSEVQTCQRHKVCLEKAGNNYSLNTPSTSGSSKAENNVDVAGFRENRKRPSSLKLNRPNLDADDSSSDTGNDDYSLGSEDGCIYTYRGGEHLADLPSSFFSLDMGLPLDRHLPMPPNYPVPAQAGANVREQGSRASSPDMDFLEMDFDPGPSCEVDTGDESSPDADLEVANIPEENEPVLREPSPEVVAPSQIPVQPTKPPSPAPIEPAKQTISASTSQAQNNTKEDSGVNYTFGPYITHVNVWGEHLQVRRTMARGPCILPVNLHLSNGDLVTPREVLHYDEENEELEAGPLVHQINQGPAMDSVNLSSALFHHTMAKKLMIEKNKSDKEEKDSGAGDGLAVAGPSTGIGGIVEPPRCMVWSETEACERQVTQIATSACGATAVVNVFIALGVPVNMEKITSAVGTRQRANNAKIPRYLLSRAVAGCTAADLVNGIQKASEGLVTARFFPMYPERAVSLSHWLADWITLGAVPILTMNLQVGCEGEIPDSWHHQMVFGVSNRGIYLSNPVECIRESAIWPKLTSPSVLLVRSRDVLVRFTPDTDLTPLIAVPDRRFNTFNVLGQVVNVLREWRASGWSAHGTRTRYIKLPVAYQAGVTVAALTGTEAHRRLSHAAQLPILAPHSEHK